MALTPEQIANAPGMGAQGIGVTGAKLDPTLNQDYVNQLVREAAAQAGGTLSFEDASTAAKNLKISDAMLKEAAASTGMITGVPSELDEFNAQTEAMLRADEEAFARSRAEIEALTRQEEEVIRRQTAEYQVAQERLQAEAQAQAQQQAMEQAIIQKQLADIQAQQAAEAAKFKDNMEGMQRTSAQKMAASRKAGRSAGARPLLGAATPDSMGQGGQSLGSAASLSGQSGSLGAQQTLGVGA
jgi:hypothetical protein